ncbi:MULTISPECIES: exodeoxyribonuclease VII small subunit [Gammaproteobacteria]|uniref:exodeoxyribonuclease VII small subunit n=1 Tax=Gammaproteobacteria TaxID=1236 RepID=UPI000DCFF1CB|nr:MULTISPECIES: exodeoxyribonuclease VII small subunit [Gammaproteobacteria]RTE85554.1 exodeoxyribonuclease VII small subunit [Aliidiomarina sp. B3213]TCZ89524.1 exodeoxyribonuclease VII small subunit [Lysobacter sp. N42]
MAEQDKAPTFESAVQELETIIESLEQGELPLEEALKQFEKAVSLSRISQDKLKAAEQKVQMLVEQNGQQTLNNLPAGEE